MKFNERLKHCRKMIGLTQEQIAIELGIKRTTYTKYETGENLPDFKILIKLADLFNVTTDYLLGRKSEKISSENVGVDIKRSCEEIIDLIEKHGLDPYEIFNIFKWRYLNKEEVQDVINYFEWIVYKSKKKVK
ncbi:transcriptional regulator with XRE-family HTH domain [Cerasibacillus quisquiliarum]|uniref:HTH cro/C1-type domain-containing protein n=1 Tax=Cerasibacillus quisquiliarum TaxID=227865 RepID=A0A511UZF5_9BACI|nr:helix-turn-helix transcriptional regulator [Cerasibacillus quisquiliarum]MBB5147209.1 transcriptional regulator with XRE-family HTH domain [Cerasibacillus quisquiliarum]GEN32024.1 hypothetical protein CQU01_22620 [Cerasibacillus quisquiliarum]